MLYDVIVVGGGPGGYTAALYAARSGLTVAVLEKLSPGGQMATTSQIDNYPGFSDGVDGFDLGQQMARQAEKYGAKTILAEVTGADLAASPKVLHTSEGDFQGRAVILATGAYPRELGLPDEGALRGRGVAYCATCDGAFYKEQTVAVIGGGNVAVEDAIFLARICRKVYVVHRRDQLRAEEILQKKLSQFSNVEMCWNQVCEKIEGQDQVEKVCLRNTKTGEEREIAVDGVFIAVGIHPNSEAFQGVLDMDESGYIRAGEDGCTNIPGIFAAGDVRTKKLRQIVTAVSDGANAVSSVQEYLSRR